MPGRLIKVPGIAYEYLRFSAAHQDNAFIRLITKPNLALQRLTTREPELAMLEVAIVAFNEVVDFEKGKALVDETRVIETAVMPTPTLAPDTP